MKAALVLPPVQSDTSYAHAFVAGCAFPAMSTDVTPIPVACPRCHHGIATLTLSSASVVSVACAKCRHEWSIDIAEMPAPVRKAVQIAMLERNPTH